MTSIARTGEATAETLIVGESRAMTELRRLVRQVAPSTASVLLSGPSGCGKEVVARAIHAESRRSAKSYVAVNCGAIPHDLLESELFGHEKGSFTGAHTQHRGRFEEAHCGTLFLDEIGDMPFDMQVKLLRVLEEHSIQRLGGSGQIAVDTRIISATHRDIESAIDADRFREDLFYRLSVFPIAIPSLAGRREDVPLLIRHFLGDAADRKQTVRFAPAAMERLVAHDWPGNVRELRNVVERACILFSGQTIGGDQVDMILHRRRNGHAERAALWEATDRLPAPVRPTEESEAAASAPVAEPTAASAATPFMLDDGPVDLRAIIAELENRYIVDALSTAEGVVAEAARLLSLKRTTLIEKMRKFGLADAAA